MIRLISMLLSIVVVAPAHAVLVVLVPRPQCLLECAATIVAQCTKTRPNGTTHIKPPCKRRIIRQCRHGKPVCPTTVTTTSSTTTTTCSTSGCAQHTLILTVPDHGSDLDTGWTGVSHNFPIIHGSQLVYELSCPDGVNCTGTATTGTGTANGLTFGAPLPLFAAGVPVCVVNRFQDTTLTGTFNLQTGQAGESTPNVVRLFSDVYLTTATGVCPKCVPPGGQGTIGDKGTCSADAKNPGHPCTINGEVTVSGQGLYLLSSDCNVVSTSGPPTTLDIVLPLTTGQAPALTGSKPCPGQASDDNCGGTGCNASCTASACATHDAVGNCIDAKGGISQLCCANNTQLACFPTGLGSSGSIVRAGHPVVPGDQSGGTFAATFCIAATTTSLINITSGLPGPGALLLPAVGMLQ